MTTCCTVAHHEALKLNAAAWSALELIGVQEIEAFEDEPAGALELRNCSCGSTLALVRTK